MKLEFSRHFFEKHSNTKFHENPPSGSRVVPCGRTDRWTEMTKLIVSLRNFANATKNDNCALLGHYSSSSGNFVSWLQKVASVELILCSIKRQPWKREKDLEAQLHPFLTSTLDEKWVVSFTPRSIYPRV